MRVLILAVLFVTLFAGCRTVVSNKAPTGLLFPAVEGTSLTGKKVQVPTDYEGKPVVLLVGYIQRTQFDIDRWLLGFTQLDTPVRLVEVPTIPGLFPGLFANRIDDGMRRGIPKSDWPSVVTVYDDGEEILNFTGNERPANARILLLDATGKVLWFTDQGYSAGQVKAVDTLVRKLP
jgi:hypothetical protein